MQETNMPTSAGQPRDKSDRRSRSYERRLKAAGLDHEDYPEDADEFRNALTRRIWMFLNEWHGCSELICARNRGCMAPNIVCANVPQPSAEEMEREWPAVQVEVYKAVKEVIAARGLGEE
jgi:hypothetical protein